MEATWQVVLRVAEVSPLRSRVIVYYILLVSHCKWTDHRKAWGMSLPVWERRPMMDRYPGDARGCHFHCSQLQRLQPPPPEPTSSVPSPSLPPQPSLCLPRCPGARCPAPGWNTPGWLCVHRTTENHGSFILYYHILYINIGGSYVSYVSYVSM